MTIYKSYNSTVTDITSSVSEIELKGTSLIFNPNTGLYDQLHIIWARQIDTTSDFSNFSQYFIALSISSSACAVACSDSIWPIFSSSASKSISTLLISSATSGAIFVEDGVVTSLSLPQAISRTQQQKIVTIMTREFELVIILDLR